MKNTLFFQFFKFFMYVSVFMSGCIEGTPLILDEIVAVMPHTGGDILMLGSDLEMSLDGTRRTIREVVIDGAMVVKARDVGVVHPEGVVEGMLASIQKKYGLTQKQLVELFEEQGFTFEEARELLKRRRMIDDLIGGLVRVDEPSKDAIADYYKAHPITSPAVYTIQLGFVSGDEMTREVCEELVRTDLEKVPVSWDEPEVYREDELAERQQFVRTMKPGEVVVMSESIDGYDLVRLVEYAPEVVMPLDEELVGAQLRQEAFINALKKFQDELLGQAKIRFCQEGAEEQFKREMEAAAEKF